MTPGQTEVDAYADELHRVIERQDEKQRREAAFFEAFVVELATILVEATDKHRRSP